MNELIETVDIKKDTNFFDMALWSLVVMGLGVLIVHNVIVITNLVK